jgi:high-affinity Fe2+/Pb2+ permease
MYLGLGAAGLVGYYLYRAGGSPKVAKKEMESEFFFFFLGPG